MTIGTDGHRVLVDDFSRGLDVGAATSAWRLRPVRGFPVGDGVVSTGPGGLVVTPTGRGPDGSPAFAEPEQPLTEGEHLRWAVFVNRDTAEGLPGVPVAPTGVLSFGATVGLRAFGLDAHPYPAEVTDPYRDLRLGSAAVICMDRETGLVLDVIVTDRCVFAVYERLAFPGSSHAGFSYAVPVADRQPDHEHQVRIEYDRGEGRACWYLGEDEVFRVEALGRRLDRPQDLLRDNGRPDEAVLPRQLYCGVALFTERVFGQGVRVSVTRVELRSGVR